MSERMGGGGRKMVTEQRPGEPPCLRPGRTAYDWVFYMVAVALLSGVGLIGIPVVARVMPVGAAGRLLLMGLFAVIGLVGGTALIVVSIGLARAMNKEKAAGYTTLFDSSKANVWQLNPRTGEVVRTPRASDAR